MYNSGMNISFHAFSGSILRQMLACKIHLVHPNFGWPEGEYIFSNFHFAVNYSLNTM